MASEMISNWSDLASLSAAYFFPASSQKSSLSSCWVILSSSLSSYSPNSNSAAAILFPRTSISTVNYWILASVSSFLAVNFSLV